MKRWRDDVLVSPHLKRPAVSSHAEPSARAQMSTASSAEQLTTTDAMSYLKAVKEIFQDNKDVYTEFLDVMKDFKAQRTDTTGVISRVKELFKGHRDLILGFNTFLPKGYEITLPPEDEPFLQKKPVEFDEAMSFVNKIKARFDGDDQVYKAFLHILNMYRKEDKSITEVYQEVSVLFQDHADLLVEFTHFLPDTSGAGSGHYSQPSRNHMLCRDDRGSPMTMYADYPDSEKWNRVEKEKGKKEDIDDNKWVHDVSDHKKKSAQSDDFVIDQFHQGTRNPISAICEKVQERLQDPEDYKKFLDCVRSYESKFVNTPQFRMLVASLLRSHPDLMEECEDLISYVEKNGGGLQNNKQIHRPIKVEDRYGDHHDRADRHKNKDHYDRERYRYDRGLATKDAPGQKMPSYSSKDKFMAKPIQDLDLSDCELCTPSYRLLPQNYPIPSASWRTNIGDEVLNDHWVSVTSGSEDYSFKHMRKNQYEESLFRCEDDRFELDMLLESVNSTAKHVEELLDSINALTDKIEISFRMEGHLTALDLRCIERLYGEHGLDVIEVLKKNAPFALPVILTRLKQKQEEWSRSRSDFNKVWAEIYAKNYHKSLDHRSFYFKQQDTKSLSCKALLAEIKELSQKNQNEDEIVLSISAGYMQPLRPHMEFEYPDPEIQNDIYQVIQFSCGQVCTPEQRDKVIKIWTAFLETLLGDCSQPPTAEETEDVEVNNHTIETVVNTDVEKGSSSGMAALGNCEPLDISNGGGENVPTDQTSSTRMQTGTDNNGINNDGSPDVSMMSTISASSIQVCFLDRVTPRAHGGMEVYEKNDSDLQDGPEGAKADCGVEALPSEEAKDGINTEPTLSAICSAPEEVKAQEYHEETDAHTKNEREKGKLSPNKNLEDNNSSAFGNTAAKAVQNHCRSDVTSTRETGGDEIEKAGTETKTNADDEIEESTQGSLDSENCDVSSADREEGSSEEQDEDGEDNKAESEGEAEGMADVHDTERIISLPDSSLDRLKPLTVRIPMALYDKEKVSEIFYGNDSFYVLFRLHKMLYERMQSAKWHSSSPENRWRTVNGTNPTDLYARFKDALYSLLNGSSDNAKFEDDCRAIIGAQSYILFTLDKLILKLIKQLQIIATDDLENRLLELYAYERSRNPINFIDAVYHENARYLLPDENLYRLEFLACPTRLTLQLMENEHDGVMAASMDPNFAAYINEELLSVVPETKERVKRFLQRNKRMFLTGNEMTDFYKVTEGLITYNCLQIKINSDTSKAAYVLGTEDLLYRPKRLRKTLCGTCSGNGASNGTSNGVSNGATSGAYCSRRAKRRMFILGL